MKFFRIINTLILAALVAGCHRETKPESSGEPKVTGEKISFPADSPQLVSLELAPVESRAPASTQLSGRLIWNDDVTVRVFTPFAGRVRKITADIGQTVEKSGSLAEVESPDFGQAQADARKAEGDLKLAERNLARLRELFAHGAAAQKDVEAAEDAQAQAEAEHSRAVSKIAAYGANADSLDEIFVLRSSLAGTVVDKSVSPGLEVRPDQMLANTPEITAPLFVVSDPAHLWIQIDATQVDRDRLDGMAGMNGRHQGVIARVVDTPIPYKDIHDILESDLTEPPFFLILDGVEDPHNLGACLRVADAMGVHAVIAPKDRAVGLNATVRKVACGAAETVPFIAVTNLARTIRELKEAGVFVVGTTMDAPGDLFNTKLDGPLAIVLGAEADGIRRLTAETCDALVTIPMFGSVESLNVSVARGICLYEARRQRNLKLPV